MKPRFGNKLSVAVIFVVLVLAASSHLAGQTTMGILPVNVASVGSNILNEQQWQSVSGQLHDYLVLQLAGIGNVSKLSREHILLLTKEIPAADIENLDAEAYKIISKKEKLHYLLKCSVESIQVADRNVIAPIRVIIVDGNNGKVFWEKELKTRRIVNDPVLTEYILLNNVFKPSVEEIAKEVLTLKY
jgi:hypothetical protein